MRYIPNVALLLKDECMAVHNGKSMLLNQPSVLIVIVTYIYVSKDMEQTIYYHSQSGRQS